MSLVLLQPNRLGPIELDDLAINSHPNKTFALEFLQHIAELPGLIADEWREHNNLCVRSISQDLIDNLLRGLTVDWLARGPIVRLTDRGEKHAQVIVNFRRGCDCRSWICPRRTLLDRNGRRQAFDEIDVWLFHLIEELPGVSGKALHIASLPFGIKRVARER